MDWGLTASLCRHWGTELGNCIILITELDSILGTVYMSITIFVSQADYFQYQKTVYGRSLNPNPKSRQITNEGLQKTTGHKTEFSLKHFKNNMMKFMTFPLQCNPMKGKRNDFLTMWWETVLRRLVWVYKSDKNILSIVVPAFSKWRLHCPCTIFEISFSTSGNVVLQFLWIANRNKWIEGLDPPLQVCVWND